MTDQQHTELIRILQEAAQMNEGQFVAITERLERIIELLEAQIAADVVDVESKAVEMVIPKRAKQTRTAKKKGE